MQFLIQLLFDSGMLWVKSRIWISFGSRVDIERDKTLIFGSTLKDNGFLPMLVMKKKKSNVIDIHTFEENEKFLRQTGR